MSLRIAFIGYNEEQTRTYFREIAELNREQVAFLDLFQGRLVLIDGTEIYRVSPGARVFHLYIDQVIIADSRRGRCQVARHRELAALSYNLIRSRVPPEFQWQHYDLDAEVSA